MGIALPGAIAAKLLFPGATVLVATGDGGFLMPVYILVISSFLTLLLMFLFLYLRERRGQGVFCLLYHRLVPEATYRNLRGDERAWAIPQENFEEQMRFLSNSGMTQVSPDEIISFISGGRLENKKNFLVTFDDGCESIFSVAYPLMKRYGIKPLIFVTADPQSPVFHSGENPQRRLTDAEIRELSESGAFIGSHGLTHIPLIEAAEDLLLKELVASREALALVTGKDVDYFAVPLNIYNGKVIARALSVYSAVFLSNPGSIKKHTQKGSIPRLNVEGTLGIRGFQSLFTPWGIIKRKCVQLFKRLPVKLFGAEKWLVLRERVYASPLGRFITMKNLMLIAGLFMLLYAAAAAYSAVKILETILRI